MNEIVLMSDPRVVATPVVECGEPLVDCREVLYVDTRRADDRGHWAHLRAGVVRRLVRAQELLPEGWQWLLVEGHRPPATQRNIFDGYVRTLRELRPAASEEELWTAATRWVAPVETAGHIAGAAVDLTVRDQEGVEVDLGCPEAATPEESNGACYTAASGLTATARRHRATMVEALTAVGLVNYPTEWWHWSYGDRYWAYTTRSTAACYGPIDLP